MSKINYERMLLLRYESLIQDKRTLNNKMEYDMNEYGSWQSDYADTYTELIKQEADLTSLLMKSKEVK